MYDTFFFLNGKIQSAKQGRLLFIFQFFRSIQVLFQHILQEKCSPFSLNMHNISLFYGKYFAAQTTHLLKAIEIFTASGEQNSFVNSVFVHLHCALYTYILNCSIQHSQSQTFKISFFSSLVAVIRNVFAGLSVCFFSTHAMPEEGVTLSFIHMHTILQTNTHTHTECSGSTDLHLLLDSLCGFCLFVFLYLFKNKL